MSFFWGKRKIPQKQDIIYHSIEKKFPKFGNLFFGLDNIFLLLYTTSDYYGNTVGPIIGKLYLHQQTKKLRLHLSYTIMHSIVKGFPNFEVQNLTWYIFLYYYRLLYTTSDYYGTIKGQMGAFYLFLCENPLSN